MLFLQNETFKENISECSVNDLGASYNEDFEYLKRATKWLIQQEGTDSNLLMYL